ncbi:MAG: HAMP domain-containing sensor histidine kinase [Microgenomates group bacterium]
MTHSIALPLRKILDTLPQKIILFDTWGVSVYANRQASHFFSTIKIKKSTIFDVLEALTEKVKNDTASKIQISHVWQSLQDEIEVYIPTVEIIEEDSEFKFEIHGSWIETRSSKFVLLSLSTVTEQRDTHSNQKTLARVLGHELKRPLNLISTYNYYITKYLTQNNTARVSTYLGKIDKKIQLLNRMLNDISLNLKTSIKDIPVKIEDVHFKPILQSTIDDYKALYPTRSFEVEMNDKKSNNVLIHADPTRTRQVFINLLENCIKYSDESKIIKITVLINSKTVTINFIDQGKGIDPEDINKIFGPYYRVTESGKGTTNGLGLGLSLSQLFMKRQNGDISVTSQPGVGSTFSLIFKRVKK